MDDGEFFTRGAGSKQGLQALQIPGEDVAMKRKKMFDFRD